jgi:hypothetical protein
VPSPALLHRGGGFRQVVVITGHLTDSPDRPRRRFPESEVPRVRRVVKERYEEWGIGEPDLVICGGARGGDLICASEARRRGATVWLLLARPAAEFEKGSVAGGDPMWIDVFRDMLQRCPSWDLSQLGDVPDGNEVYELTNEWMLDVGEVQATERPLIVLAIWDGADAAGVGGSGGLVAEARQRSSRIEVVDPLP